MPSLNQEGEFRAKVLDIGLRESKDGSSAIGVGIKFLITEILHGDEWQDWREHGLDCYGTIYIVKRDGTVNKHGVESLRDSLDWNGRVEQFGDENHEWPHCRITVEESEYNGKISYRMVWLNPYGSSGGGMKKADTSIVKAFSAKYGSAMRALCGERTATLKPPIGKPSPAMSAPKSPPPTKPEEEPEHQTTRDDAWAAFCNEQKKLNKTTPGRVNDDQLAESWATALSNFDEKDESKLTAASWEWMQVMGIDAIGVSKGDEIPF